MKRQLDHDERADLTRDLMAALTSNAGLHDTDKMTGLIAQLANLSGVTDRALKKARRKLPSFSGAKWEDLSGKYNLPEKRFTSEELPVVHVTPCYLPLSMHIELFEAHWRAADVYRDKEQQTREAARVRLLEMYLLPLLALFRGRIIDKPEDNIVESDVSTGGEVEHKIFAVGAAFFLVVEVKLVSEDADRHHALLFSELLSAAKLNAGIRWRSAIPVHGLLTDLTDYRFYSFNPVTQEFALDEELMTIGRREDIAAEMIPVTNKIFGILLSGYITVLEAQAAIHARDATTKQTDYLTALRLAKEASGLFTSRAKTVAALKDQATQGLAKLEQSVLLIPRAAKALLKDNEPRNALELRKIAEEHVGSYHMKYICDTEAS